MTPTPPATPPESLPPARQAPWRAHAERRAAAQERLAQLDRVSARYANARGLAFLAAGALVVLALTDRIARTHLWTAVGALAAYALLAVLHSGVFRREARQRHFLALSDRGLARLSGGWRELPERGERFETPGHLYARDLDVFGQASLFQLMNETATRAGEERLAAWLGGPADAGEVAARQGAARELAGRLDFREDTCVEGRVLSGEKADPAQFIRWAEAAPSLAPVRWAVWPARLLPPLTLALWVLGSRGVLPSGLWYLGLAAQAVVLGLTWRTLGAYAQALEAGEHGFVRYAPLFARVEREPLEHPRLRTLQAGLERPGGARVSHHLASFSRRYAWAEFRRHQFHPIVHLLTLADVHTMFALEAWRAEHGPHVRDWFRALGELEALACLAGLAHDRPDFTFPEVVDGPPAYAATALGHALLDAPVLNDVALPGPASALLVTGSNMSGKTTLLRAMGLNAVLALAGAPVCAASLRLSCVQVLTSMRVQDSLEQGVSFFYAEVRRLKTVLDAAAAARGRALFLLDEILLGTNTRERQIASREVLELLLATGAFGGVTTHDLSLAVLADAHPGRVLNVHFRDHLEEGRMVFDYRLRQGVVDTTNALRVLRLAGVPVSGEG